MIDVNASLGHWPFGLLRHNTPGALRRLLGSLGVRQACVAPIEGLLHEDVRPANRRMHQAVRPHRPALLPFSVINPNFPGWRADLEECRRDLKTTGVRLYPSYHGYEIDEGCCLELLEELQRGGLPVQIAPVVSDPRMHHPRACVPPARLDALGRLLREFPRLNFAVLNIKEFARELPDPRLVKRLGNLFIDIAWVDGVCCVDALMERFGAGAILLGTNAPLMEPLGALYKLREATLRTPQLGRITRDNARRFLGRARAGAAA